VSNDYVSEGYELAEVQQNQRSVDASTKYAIAKSLIAQSDCNNCHHLDGKSIGPMFIDIADRYKSKQQWALDSLPKKIRAGGSGVWGEVNMPAHPAITLNDARLIVNYILHSNEKTISSLPLSGSYTQQVPAGDNGKGTLVLRAAYTDKSAAGAAPLTNEGTVVLKAPHLNPGTADQIHDAEIKKQLMFVVSTNVIPKNNGYIGFKKIDLTGIQQLELAVSASPREGFTGGDIEIRLGSPTGTLIGQTKVVPVDPFAALLSKADAAQNAGGKDAKKAAAPPAAKPPKKKPAFDLASLFNRPGLKVDITPSDGWQDLYLVFKNPEAKPRSPLLSISDIKLNTTQTK
jgi:cytochrome c